MKPGDRRPTRVRHKVLWLTVAVYMITYIDRVVIASAAPAIRQELGISLVTFGWILSSFRWGYTIFQIPSGWLGDLIGPRRALAAIVTWWSVFTAAIALAWSAASIAVIRFLFGVGQAGAFPIATRALSRWMLPEERGFAQGITHAGSRLGAAITPPVAVALMAVWGWRPVFLIFGAIGIVWAAVWMWWYRDTPDQHPGVNNAEQELIGASLGQPRRSSGKSVPWKAILSERGLWTLCAMYFCYAYCIAVYLDWLPTYLNQHRGFNLREMGWYASLPLFAGTLGDLAGGWISDIWAHRSGNLKLARRGVAVFGFLLAAASIVPATLTRSSEACVWYTCLAVFALELTVGVSWAIPLDTGGDYAGSVSAIMNTCGNVGGALSPTVLAYLVEGYGWDVPFGVSAVLCLIAAVLFLRIDASRPIAGLPAAGAVSRPKT